MLADSEFFYQIYEMLLAHFGPRGWWPGESTWEIMVGAVLTQAVAWKNVEKAILNLKRAGLLELEAMCRAEEGKIAELIKPALYHRQKARKLKNLAGYVKERYGGNLELMFSQETKNLRGELLSLWGIGKETADSILLYAGEKPVFVIDAYTIRIFSRLGIVDQNTSYDMMQELMHRFLPSEVELYNEYHALLVALGANYCKKNNPICNLCPINNFCNYLKIQKENK
ncbi:DNA-3-methyladenine glycosylase III [Thermosyntropha lipolytica DSM 11003]|uniref:DNA-3-methyladenine glycosylase III n=1 Tax=Thermosyntropha lipolytica DSM 11003 TaxID=1123382 RepID=A0A1M5P0L3_9FIRM|nr:endonuclease III domain-containing protein [Thermosyntropha lipolytica]SHG94969.1 DNA-3-methyladenine glycosylase III [Thermosyntropha lipolytica DSM 11003]